MTGLMKHVEICDKKTHRTKFFSAQLIVYPDTSGFFIFYVISIDFRNIKSNQLLLKAVSHTIVYEQLIVLAWSEIICFIFSSKNFFSIRYRNRSSAVQFSNFVALCLNFSPNCFRKLSVIFTVQFLSSFETIELVLETLKLYPTEKKAG